MAGHGLANNARAIATRVEIPPETSQSPPIHGESELQIQPDQRILKPKQRAMRETSNSEDVPAAKGGSNWLPTIAPALQNSGGVARDHLASERTFLAYVRTSLSIASGGVALAQVLSLKRPGGGSSGGSHWSNIEAFARPLGASAIAVALLVLGIGVIRYFSIQKALVRGRFPVARKGVLLIAGLLGALVAVTSGLLLDRRVKTS